VSRSLTNCVAGSVNDSGEPHPCPREVAQCACALHRKMHGASDRFRAL
jgi:hypothetical protein